MSATSPFWGSAVEALRGLPSDVVVPRGLEGVARSLPTHGLALCRGGDDFRGLPDGNRSIILPSATTMLDGRMYAVSAKGVGALAPLYGDGPDAFDAPTGRTLWGEAWFGESPWGGQGDVGGDTAIEVTELAGGPVWRGFYLCPTVGVVVLPEELVAPARDRWWYRRHRGRFVQEHRLVPSNVRLYQQSERTLAGDPDGVLAAFDVVDRASRDAFVERYAASGIAALTLYARSLREGADGPEGLTWHHVWLDKDSVVAPDGALHFADTEGLGWTPATRGRSVEDHVRAQFEENWYEFAFGIDALLAAADRADGRRRTRSERRHDAAIRIELALQTDPWAMPERTRAGLDVWVNPEGAPPVRIRVIDLEGRSG